MELPSLPSSPTSIAPAAWMSCRLCPPRLSWASLRASSLLHITNTGRPGSRKGAWGISSQHYKLHCSPALSSECSAFCPQNTGREWEMTNVSGDLIPRSKHMPYRACAKFGCLWFSSSWNMDARRGGQKINTQMAVWSRCHHVLRICAEIEVCEHLMISLPFPLHLGLPQEAVGTDSGGRSGLQSDPFPVLWKYYRSGAYLNF